MLQPFRYRSYYYDTDSGLYYLQSRYYDPVTHRFINADTEYISTGSGIVGHNMFAYCDNNPVNHSDPTGMCGDPTCVSCNPERRAFVEERTKKGWYDSVYPGFVPYSCSSAYDNHTVKTQSGAYASYSGSRRFEDTKRISSGGDIKLIVNYDVYEDTSGFECVSIRNFTYSINNNFDLDYISVVYGCGEHTNSIVENKNYGFYAVDCAPEKTAFPIGVNITAYFNDGTTVRLVSNYTNGEKFT